MRVGKGRAVALLAALGLLVAAPAAGASTTSVLAQGHPYRHGVVPTRAAWVALSRSATSSANLRFGGGISGVGVTTGAPKVYLVFWGSQWGTQGTNSAGNVTLSGDPSGMAPYVEAFMKGLGTGSELWSGVMTQYCQGVNTGAQTCPSSNTQHVGYPTGGAFAGVWVDESAAEPTTALGHAIGAEAVKAAGHFGNTTSTLNRNAQYVIISPHGTDPDNYKTQGFCAWHDYTGDTTLSGGGAVSSPYGALAFTNLPYITDAGAGCGQNFVNAGSAGKLDGVSIVEGHEYAETITDQFPAGGWTDSSGAENGDKCAWISSGSGRSQNISLTTGAFAVQSTWANDGNSGSGACEISHPIVTNPTSGCTASQLLGNPGFETGTAAPWVASASNVVEPASAGETPHSGNDDAWLGFGTATEASIQQSVTVPSGCTSYTFSFWLHIDTANTGTGTSARMRVRVQNSSGTVLAVLATFTNLNAASGYQQHSYNLSAYAGQTVTLRFGAAQSSSQRTNFVIDDTALNVS